MHIGMQIIYSCLLVCMEQHSVLLQELWQLWARASLPCSAMTYMHGEVLLGGMGSIV